MEFAPVMYEINGGIATITINNPPVNALNNFVMSELDKVFDWISSDASIQVVIVTGSGDKSFVAGADISQFPDMDKGSGKEFALQGQKLFARIMTLEQPVIAAINGYCLGGGCELALACDIRIAGENALIGLPEVNLGIVPCYGGTQRLPRLVGTGMAMLLICTGDPINAGEALRIGLVEKTVPQGKSLEAAIEIAKRMMLRGPLAIRAVKKAIHGGMKIFLEEGLLLEAELLADCALQRTKKKVPVLFWLSGNLCLEGSNCKENVY